MKLIDKSLFKFILVGIINTIVGSAIMFLSFNLLNFGYWLSSALNYTIGTILSFFLNKYFTFSVKEFSLFMILAFIINILCSYFIAYGIAKPLVNYFLQTSPQKFRENMALVTGMCIFTVINYFGQKYIVFKHRTNKKAA